MTKNIILLLGMLILVSACGRDNKTIDSQKQVTSKETYSSVNKNLREWFTAGDLVQCVINSPQGDITVITNGEDSYITGIPYVSPDSTGKAPKVENGLMLTRGEWTYLWDKTTKKGIKMNTKEMEEDKSEQKNFEDMMNEWEESNFAYDCKKFDNDSVLNEPTDVEFMNLNDIIGGLMNSEKNIPDKESIKGMDQAELEKMMQGLR
jgi:hypothetical protein